ncbi:MAG: PhoU domain-containing protein [Candidatus Ranarchaeia archaeon]
MVELRKLQKTGGATFFVTLPKRWILQHGLVAGDLVQLLKQPGGYLLITPLDPKRNGSGASSFQKELGSQIGEMGIEGRVVHLNSSSSLDLARDILDYYMQGVDVIRIMAQPPKRLSTQHRHIVKFLSQKLVGVEIIDEDQHSITLQCLINPTTLPLPTVLQRTYKLASSMHLEATQSLVHLDQDLAHAVIIRDEEVDRLYFLAVRQLRTLISDPVSASRAHITPLQALDHRLLAKYIETIADHATSIATIALRIHSLFRTHLRKQVKEKQFSLPKDIVDTLIDLSRQAETRLAKAFTAYWNHDTDMAASLLHLTDEEPTSRNQEANPSYLNSLYQLSKRHSDPPLHPDPVIHNQILALLSTVLSLLTGIDDLATDIGGLVTSPSD